MPRPVRTPPSAGEKPIATRDKLRKSLLSWYDQQGRRLPWRQRGRHSDPYKVWLSEIMLQQTVVAAVTPYFLSFVERWPDVQSLADADREDVLAAWAGLGYYSRARNLHAAAQSLAQRGFPEDEAGWRQLPGIGAYSAAAIAAIAYGCRANVVDGNVERVMARLHAVETPLPGAKPELRDLAGKFTTSRRPGDWAQALMDLGATLCTPRSPKCSFCPWQGDCAAFRSGSPEGYPRRAAKPGRPTRYGAAFRIEREGRFWLVRRPERGLLAGMAGLPTTPWRARKWTRREALEQAPGPGEWRRMGQVRHVFTHFALTLDVYAANAGPEGGGWWGDASVLPTVFRKAVAL
ncbi:MAG: A/G-specific adenine glycosylase [Terricaulis sp.]